MNPLHWKPEHRAGLLATMAVGAALGILFRYVFFSGGGSLAYWLTSAPDDALTWAVLGAVIVGGSVYARRSFSNR